MNKMIVMVGAAAAIALLAKSQSQISNTAPGAVVKNYVIPGAGRLYLPWFYQAENEFKIPRNLLVRIAQQESGFNPNAENKTSGALGMMQIVPKWHPGITRAGILDPYTAINYAGKYLREMFNKYHSWTMALAAYNWGPGNLDKYGIEKAPAETVAYIKNISYDVDLTA